MANVTRPFWEKPLDALSGDEWEQLCDGCGQCCLVKLQDDETDEVFVTDVACQFLDMQSGCCSVYADRATKKPECIIIDRDDIEHYRWLPETCAYRLRSENKPLPNWHPLISPDRALMESNGVAVTTWCTPENQVDDCELTERIVYRLRARK